MNRIEGNVLDNRAEIVQEVIDRTTSVGNEEAARIAADGVLQSYVDSQVAIEASARIAGDATKISSSELIGRVYTAVSTTTNRTDILPAGLYYVKCNSSTSLAVRDSGGIWRTIIKSPQGIMAISDGANIQMSATPPMGSTAGWEAIKIS